MLKFVLFRVFYSIIILFITSFLIFSLLRLNGSEPINNFLIQSNLPNTEKMYETIKKEFNLDKPLLMQYVAWLKNVINLDFGVSFISGRDVRSDFFAYLPNTLLLIFLSMLLVIFASIPLGVISAVYKDKFPDFIIRFFCLLGVSVPGFWLAFLLVFIFAIKLGWLSPIGFNSLKDLIIPIICISLMSLSVNTRLIRSSMLEAKKERFVFYAKLRNLSKSTITFKHIFFNASLPIITAFGMHLGELVGGVILIESIFAIPGIGLYSIQGIANNDYPIIQCFVLFMCFVFVIANLLVDVLYAFFDVRIYKASN